MVEPEVHKIESNIIIDNLYVTKNNGYVNFELTIEQAEELYNRLDFMLHNITRAEVECQLNDLQYRESKLKESVAFANRNA